MGFQSGAIEYAQKYGIQLMEIRHPTDNDWKGRMRNLQFNIEMYSIDNIKPCFIIDKERIKEHDEDLIKNDKNSFPLSEVCCSTIFLYFAIAPTPTLYFSVFFLCSRISRESIIEKRIKAQALY